MRLVPLQAQPSTAADRATNRNAAFGHRRSASARHQSSNGTVPPHDEGHINRKSDGSVEVSWVPTPRSRSGTRVGSEAGKDDDDDEPLVGRGGKPRTAARQRGVEKFGAGMEKGGVDQGARVLNEQERSGRKQRRRGMRSGSKNALRPSS